MYSQGEIEAAVEAGALAPEQAASFREFVARRNNTPTVDEEYFRLVRGYNDIFVTYACVLTLIALGWLGTLVPIGGGSRGMGMIPALPIFTPLLVAAASWGMAEIFTRRRRTAFPSLLLVATFGLGVFVTLAMILLPMANGPSTAAIFGAVSAAIAAGATWGHWMRFRVPLAPTIAIGLGAIAIAMLIGATIQSRAGIDILNIVLLLIGFGVFAYAMRWDLSDRWRVTEKNEVGFWLHGLAAALIVMPIMYLLGLSSGVGSVGGGIMMIVLFLLLALVGLAINRKVLLISGLSPLIYALNSLIPATRSGRYGNPDPYGGDPYGAADAYGSSSLGSPYGGSSANLLGGTMLTLLIIGIILLLLAIFWAPLRRAVLGILPAGLRAKLPGTDATPVEQAQPFQ